MENGELTIRIVRPSSREKDNILATRITELENSGFRVRFSDIPKAENWPFTAGTIADRAQALSEALLEEDTDILLSARGGYGASDLLPHLPWHRLKSARSKVIVGFSDVSALHSAVFAKLGWPGVHGPMPTMSHWRQDGFEDDVDNLLTVLRSHQPKGSINLTSQFGHDGESVAGWLFGGCFSVLTNLIGTPYFPKTLEGAILFWEDIGENPARLIRYLNQWLQSGSLKGVKAIILGQLVNCDSPEGEENSRIAQAFAERTDLPLFVSPDFGHGSPNYPIMIGSEGQITETTLFWQAKEII